MDSPIWCCVLFLPLIQRASSWRWEDTPSSSCWPMLKASGGLKRQQRWTHKWINKNKIKKAWRLSSNKVLLSAPWCVRVHSLWAERAVLSLKARVYLRLFVEILAKIKRDANVTAVMRMRAGINLWNAPVSPATLLSRDFGVAQCTTGVRHHCTQANISQKPLRREPVTTT